MSPQGLSYDTICRILGRAYLEYQLELERMAGNIRDQQLRIQQVEKERDELLAVLGKTHDNESVDSAK